jgi:hypothetical protein
MHHGRPSLQAVGTLGDAHAQRGPQRTASGDGGVGRQERLLVKVPVWRAANQTQRGTRVELHGVPSATPHIRSHTRTPTTMIMRAPQQHVHGRPSVGYRLAPLRCHETTHGAAATRHQVRAPRQHSSMCTCALVLAPHALCSFTSVSVCVFTLACACVCIYIDSFVFSLCASHFLSVCDVRARSGWTSRGSAYDVPGRTQSAGKAAPRFGWPGKCPSWSHCAGPAATRYS